MTTMKTTPKKNITKKAKESEKKKSSKILDQVGVLKEFTQTTSNIVQKAASILEEEIAAGIVAAKQVEESIIDVKELRSESSDQVMQRFRKDAHELVDIFMDVANATTKYLGKLTQSVITIPRISSQKKEEFSASSEIPNLTFPDSIKPGKFSEVPLTLENKNEKSTDEFSFYGTDLVNPNGKILRARNLTFNPTKIKINPKSKKNVNIRVDVPKTTPLGVYSGLILASNLSNLRAVLVVNVE